MRTLADINTDRSRMRSKISDLTAEGEAIAARAEGGKFTDGQAERAERLATGIEKATAELERFDAEAVDALRAGVDAGRYSEDFEPESRRHDSGPSMSPHRRALRDAGLRAIDRHRDVLSARSADRLDELVRDERHGDAASRYLDAVANPHYGTAFGKILAYGDGAHLRMSREEMAAVQDTIAATEARALSLTGASGGFAVPFELDPSIINTGAGSINPLRQISRVVTIAVDEWRGVTSTGITAAYAAEATETTDNAPTLVQPTISTEKAQAFVPFSIEVGMDWSSIQSELAGLLATAKDDLENLKFTVGSGTNEPFGVITGATTTVNATAGGVFDAEDVFRLQDSLPARHQANASFVGSGTIINKIAQFETGGGALQFPETRDGRLLRHPLYENSSMAIVTSVGALFLIYGDFSKFVIVDRIGLQVELIPHIFGTNHRPTGQRGLFAFWRNSSKVIDSNAFRVLIGLA